MCCTGCDSIFGLKAHATDAGPDGPPYDRCGPFLYDDALRYAAIANPGPVPAPWSWDDARAMCRARGMDLAVFNDAHELGMAAEAVWPYWIGQQIDSSGETTVDGCPPATSITSGQQLVPPGSLGCGIVASANEVDATSCTGELPATFDSPVVLAAMCETPRPADASCLERDPTRERYVESTAPRTFDDARAFCRSQHGHLVVFETEEEWHHVSTLVSDPAATIPHGFWLGSQFTDTAWQSENGCPSVFSWAATPPTALSETSCAAGQVVTVTVLEDPEHAGTFLRGATVTPCNDGATYALCEIE